MDAFDLLVQSRFGNLALVNVDHQAAVAADEPNVQSLFEFVPLAADHDAVAVAIRVGTRDYRVNGRRLEATNALEKIRYLLVLKGKLRWICDVLILTATAGAEIGTRRLNPVARGCKDTQEFGSREPLFHLDDFHLDRLSWSDKRHEDHKFVVTADAFASERNIRDL